MITNYPQKELTRGLQAIPAVRTTVPDANGDTWLSQIVVTNVSNATATFSIWDGQGGGVPFFPNTPVDPGQPLVFSVAQPVLFKGGFQWQASAGTTLYADVIATTLGS